MATVSTPYGALSLAVTKAASLAATNVVVGFIDEFNRGRKYDLLNSGLAPQTGDTAAKWLPSVLTVTSVVDPAGSGQIGQYVVTLSPGSADTVNVASVQTIRVDANTLFITATGTF